MRYPIGFCFDPRDNSLFYCASSGIGASEEIGGFLVVIWGLEGNALGVKVKRLGALIESLGRIVSPEVMFEDSYPLFEKIVELALVDASGKFFSEYREKFLYGFLEELRSLVSGVNVPSETLQLVRHLFRKENVHE